MPLTLKIKESRLSPDGLFFLRAARCQGVEHLLALRRDDNGHVFIDLGANGERPEILIMEDGQVISWTMPRGLLNAYRADEIGQVKLINEAGRNLRQHAVVGMRWLIRDWIADFGERFGVTSEEYVRQMCKGKWIGLGGQRKPYQAKLPAPFRGVQDGGRWFITV
jgi:hypothetical protein